jgi:hypothetical protein
MKRLFMVVLVLTGFAVMDASAAKKAKANPMDTDKDGKVSKQEFVDYSIKLAEKNDEEVSEDVLNKQFVAKDKDKDGFLSAAELTKASKKGAKAAKVTQAADDEEEDADADEEDDSDEE